MGHASITITLDRYGHLMPGNEAEAADLLDADIAREREAWTWEAKRSRQPRQASTTSRGRFRMRLRRRPAPELLPHERGAVAGRTRRCLRPRSASPRDRLPRGRPRRALRSRPETNRRDRGGGRAHGETSSLLDSRNAPRRVGLSTLGSSGATSGSPSFVHRAEDARADHPRQCRRKLHDLPRSPRGGGGRCHLRRQRARADRGGRCKPPRAQPIGTCSTIPRECADLARGLRCLADGTRWRLVAVDHEG